MGKKGEKTDYYQKILLGKKMENLWKIGIYDKLLIKKKHDSSKS